MPAMAMTDHGNLFGAIEFYEKAKAHDLAPIIGIEAYVQPERSDRERERERAQRMDETTFRERNNHHLILLAKNQTGYRNLLKLSSYAYLEGFYYKPRMNREVLSRHSEGLVALSGCLSGEVNTQLLQGDFEAARETARFYQEIFDGNFYLELQDHGLDEDRVVLPRIVDLARELDLPMAATNDAHYLAKDHAEAHDALLCIQTGKQKEDANRLKFGTHEMYLKSPEEMYALFAGQEHAVENTVRIAEQCAVDIEFGNLKLPHFPCPDGFDSLEEYLDHLCEEGLRKRYREVTPHLMERLRYELGVIHQMGYAGYFLIVMDFIQYARKINVPVGPGRGSAAGSLVSYCLGITNIDPMKYNLLFERFLNPERISMPDIDVDFSDRGRGKVIQYVVEKYGAENVCQIITFGTMAARAAVRDVGRVMGMPYGEVDRLAKMVPAELGITLDKALEQSADLKERHESDAQVKELISTAKVLEGLARHASTHAAGVVITPTPLTDYVPLYRSNDEEITTQFDMTACEKIGLLKMDFLGLRTLTVIEDTLAHLADRDVSLDLDALPLDDPPTFALFAAGHTVGVFQFESSGMVEYLRKLKPEAIDDLIAMNALYRPGPLGSGMVDDFILRKHGGKRITYEHPSLEPILADTYGVIVYQEQVMQIASSMGGYSLGQADLLRKAMGKKKVEIMAEQRVRFVTSAVERGIKQKLAEAVFDKMAHFAGYGFNKSHSAGYALVAYQTAYLKAHYPVEFMAATLTSEMSNSDRVMVLLAEARRMGIEVLPPCVNHSVGSFSVDGSAIRFGLGAVKGVGAGAVESVVDGRADGPYRDLFDFVERVDTGSVNKKCVEALICSGAMDSCDAPRAAMAEAIGTALEWASRRKKERDIGQESLFGGGGSGPVVVPPPSLPSCEEWDGRERLTKEKGALGFFVSGHPLDEFRELLEAISAHSTHYLTETPDSETVMVGGLPIAVKISTDKRGRALAFFTLEDFTGTIECITFEEPLSVCRPYLGADVPMLVRGRLSTREGEKPKIIVEQALGISAMMEKGHFVVHLALSTSANESTLAAVRDVLSRHPGACPVFLHVDHRALEGVIVRSRSLRVQPTDALLEDLRTVVDAEAFRLTVGEARGSFRSVDVFGVNPASEGEAGVGADAVVEVEPGESGVPAASIEDGMVAAAGPSAATDAGSAPIAAAP